GYRCEKRSPTPATAGRPYDQSTRRSRTERVAMGISESPPWLGVIPVRTRRSRRRLFHNWGTSTPCPPSPPSTWPGMVIRERGLWRDAFEQREVDLASP